MTPSQLIAHFRNVADDNAAPYLWSDALLMTYANEGQVEACRRARLLLDTTTSAVCQIPVVTGTAVVSVDPRVLFIRRVKLASQTRPLPKISVADLDLHRPGWETDANNAPVAWAPIEDHKIRLIAPPNADDTLYLHVVRDPLADIALAVVSPATAAVNPEIPARYHISMAAWMFYRAYLHRERQDQYRPEESARYLAEFEGEFGKKSTAIDETWIARNHGYDEFDGVY